MATFNWRGFVPKIGRDNIRSDAKSLTCQNCHTHWRSSSMLTHISHTSICIFCHKSFQIILNWAKTKEEGSVNDQRLWLWEDDIGKMWEYWSEVQGSVGSPSHHLHPSIIHSCQTPTCGDPGDCCSLLREIQRRYSELWSLHIYLCTFWDYAICSRWGYTQEWAIW